LGLGKIIRLHTANEGYYLHGMLIPQKNTRQCFS